MRQFSKRFLRLDLPFYLRPYFLWGCALAILLGILASNVQAKSSSFSGGSRSSFSSSRSSFSTTKSTSKGFSTTPKSNMAKPAPKVTTTKSAGSSAKTGSTTSQPKVTNNYYHTNTPVGYGSDNFFSGNFWMWMYLFNRPSQTVIQQGTSQAQPTPTPQPKVVGCDKQWWQFWRAFERC